MKSNLRTGVVKLLRRKIDPKEYLAIRQLWIAHSLAEDAHDIAGLMMTLTDDCVYTIGNNDPVSMGSKTTALHRRAGLLLSQVMGNLNLL